ncbi:hypothetical protein ACLK19_21695 [Escherichia coli]
MKRIQNAGTEVVEAKAGGGSATLSTGQAAARFGSGSWSCTAGRTRRCRMCVKATVTMPVSSLDSLLLGKNGVEESVNRSVPEAHLNRTRWKVCGYAEEHIALLKSSLIRNSLANNKKPEHRLRFCFEHSDELVAGYS